MRIRGVLIPAVFLALAFFGARVSASPAVLELDLSRTAIAGVASWSDRGVEVVTGSDELRTAAPGETLAVTAGDPGGVAPAEGAGWVDLVDGQRLVGEPSGTPSDGESIGWRVGPFGEVWVPLERVRRVVMPGAEPEAGWDDRVDPLSDAVLLSNGDVLTGYVLGAGDEVSVERADGSVARAPASRVSSLRLANPSSAPEGSFVWLADGSVLRAGAVIDVSGANAQVELPGGESGLVGAEEILALLFEASSLAALSGLEVQEKRAPAGRRWAPALTLEPAASSGRSPLLFTSDVVVPGPMTVSWRLPEGASRFGATASLPAGALPWGACEVVVRDGGEEVFRGTLDAETPKLEIAVGLVTRDLEIEVEAGRYGPVGDVVRLSAPRVLVGD